MQGDCQRNNNAAGSASQSVEFGSGFHQSRARVLPSPVHPARQEPRPPAGCPATYETAYIATHNRAKRSGWLFHSLRASICRSLFKPNGRPSPYGLSQKFCNEPEALATDEPWKIRRLRFRLVRRLLQNYCDGP